MVLFALLLLPLGLGLAGLAFSQGRVNWKEFLVHEGVMALLITLAYFLALRDRTADTEIWNGTVAFKTREAVQCCHSYSCDCHEVCSGSGKDKSCRESCDTCYRHGPRKSGAGGDIAWTATSTNDEKVFHDGCNPPGSDPPPRWNMIVMGEPTAFEHRYTNYIKGNPDSILRREGAAERFKGRLPNYPRVYDWYRANRFIAVGVQIPDQSGLNRRLSQIDGFLGDLKEVDVIVVVVKEADQAYLEALRESWLGGKKNDFVVVIGAPDFPAIAWTGVLSWTKNEALKVDVRDAIMAIPEFDGTKILDIVEKEVRTKFVRRRMEDFEYLKSTIEPTSGLCWTIGIVAFLMAVGLQIWFWYRDPFGSDHSAYRSKRRRTS